MKRIGGLQICILGHCPQRDPRCVRFVKKLATTRRTVRRKINMIIARATLDKNWRLTLWLKRQEKQTRNVWP
jgi:hypothetical protein